MKQKLGMKNKVVGLLMAGSFVVAVVPVLAEEGNNHSHQHQSMEHDNSDGVAESSESLWAKIDQQHLALSAAVKGGELNMVHEHAFAIRDLAMKLSPFAAAEKKERVESGVNAIAKLANDLDTSGDAGDQAATDSNLKKFDGMLKVLKAQFESHGH